jgi:hypothetical protein
MFHWRPLAFVIALWAVLAALAFALPAGAATSPRVWSSSNPQSAHQVGNSELNFKDFGLQGPQTLFIDKNGSWGVTTDQPAGNTRVLTYPSLQTLEYLPISKIQALHAHYNVTFPAKGDYETAFDIWVQDSGNPHGWGNDTEVMLWVNNHGQRPAGSIVGSATTEYDQQFTVWLRGAKDTGDSTITMVLNNGQTAGTMHIMSVFRWLAANGYITSNAADLDVEFGWEVCSTGGVPETFLSHYALTRTLR